jgi:hypothetical protein
MAILEPPAQLTAACSRFFEDHVRLMSLIAFVGAMADRSDEAARIATQTLIKLAKTDEEKQKYERVAKERGSATKTLSSFRIVLLEMVHCRSVDNFLTYVSELLTLVFRTRPETMRSGDSEKLDYILQFQSMDDLVAAIAEKRVNDLSYEGIGKLSKYLEDRIGLELFTRQDDLERARYLVELRNLIVHNRGIVNQSFLSRLSHSNQKLGKVGEPIDLNVDVVFDGCDFLVADAFDIDGRAAAKFGLPLLKASNLNNPA